MRTTPSARVRLGWIGWLTLAFVSLRCGPPAPILDAVAQLPENQRLSLPGLHAPVDVVRDDLGIPHVYANDLHDAVFVQGYLQATDRLVQMDLIRRSAEGLLAEFGGALAPGLVDSDIFMRTIGLRRVAQRIWDSFAPGDESREMLVAFADGVNAYLDRLAVGLELLPAAYGSVFPPSSFPRWTPVDTLSIVRYQEFSLSWDGEADIGADGTFRALASTFVATNPDPALRERAGAVRDLLRWAPADPTTTRTGFPSGEGPAFLPPRGPSGQRPAVPPQVFRRTAAFVDLSSKLAENHRASNNWLVSGMRTASGAAILANDPHLSLTSPAVFHPIAFDLSRGGEFIRASGVGFPGIPGLVLGFNDSIAWGATTTGFDVTDAYLETVTGTAASGAATVLFNGAQVPVQYVTESIPLGTGANYDLTIEWVPHHGPIVPEIVGHRVVPRTSSAALSWRWTGFEPTNEVSTFLALMRARTVDDAEAAFDSFRVGAQNFVFADTQGNIFWTTSSRVPVRDPRAMTWDPVTNPMGTSPCFVLPGTGEAEWTGDLDELTLPHERNPLRGYIATANGDPVGVTLDGNPFDDSHYVGCAFDLGFRVGRITERLQTLTAAGQVTLDDMQALQADSRSPLGPRMAPFIAAAVALAREEVASPGTHPDLSAVVTEAGARFGQIDEAAQRLAAWTFETPPAVEGAPAAAEIADSVATTIFNVWLVRFAAAVLGDELAAAGVGLGTEAKAKTLLFLLEQPASAATYDAAFGDSLLFDDLTTTAPQRETRNERIVRSLLAAVDYLTATEGVVMDEWRWGKLHAVRFDSIVPSIVGVDLSLPPAGDPVFPLGFPRHGENFTVDVAGFGLSDDDYTYGGGPAQRLVVEMLPTGPVGRNVLPGGVIFDPDSTHFDDQADAWRTNQAFPVAFTMGDVVARAEQRIHITP